MNLQHTHARSSLLEQAVDLARRASENGRLPRDDLYEIVERISLPANLFEQLKVALGSLGIEVVDAGSRDEPDRESERHRRDSSDLRVLSKLARHRVLTAEEEVALAQRIDRGRLAQSALEQRPDLPEEVQQDLQEMVSDGRRAAEEFVLCNIRLVLAYAKKAARHLRGCMTLEDLVQEGIFGLYRAVEKFDHTRGFKFSTYATWWIRQSLQRAIENQSDMIRRPVHVNDTLQQLTKARRLLQQKFGREPGISELAEFTQLSVKEVTQFLSLRKLVPISLNSPPPGFDQPYAETLADAVHSPVETQVVARDLHRSLNKVCAKYLDTRERLIIEQRFGLRGDSPETLEAIGQQLGLTRERIRQIETRALTKLRAACESEGIDAFLEEDGC